jgi:hypothetical protein
MSARTRGGTVSGVVDEGLFMVVVEGRSSASDVVGMQRALRQAVSRMSAGGVSIRWCRALLLTDTCRCLCLVQAAHRSDVVLARDIAALPSARVHPVHPLDDRPWHVPAPHPAPCSDS